jgi:hypothetical protein
MLRFTALILGAILSANGVFGQDNKDAVTYEELYDEPYAVNKLFIGFQPIYAELFTTNPTAGFGVHGSYYYRDKADFHAQVRLPYGASFFDFNRDLARKNSDVTITPQVFSYIELGGTYHIKDSEMAGKTKMTLYRNSYKGDKWASRVPLQTEIPAKLRVFYGVRAGVLTWKSTVNVNNVLDKQGLTSADIVNESEQGLPETILDPTTNVQDEFNIFTNMSSTSIYVGGAMGRFRNVAVSFDNYEGAIDDNLVTYYFDIMIAPVIKVNPVEYNGVDYSTNALKRSPVGARIGVDGKFNRTLSWAYGGEMGLRPGLSGRSFYAMFKLSFPVFGTNLDNKVESFGK